MSMSISSRGDAGCETVDLDLVSPLTYLRPSSTNLNIAQNWLEHAEELRPAEPSAGVLPRPLQRPRFTCRAAAAAVTDLRNSFVVAVRPLSLLFTFVFVPVKSHSLVSYLLFVSSPACLVRLKLCHQARDTPGPRSGCRPRIGSGVNQYCSRMVSEWVQQSTAQSQ